MRTFQRFKSFSVSCFILPRFPLHPLVSFFPATFFEFPPTRSVKLSARLRKCKRTQFRRVLARKLETPVGPTNSHRVRGKSARNHSTTQCLRRTNRTRILTSHHTLMSTARVSRRRVRAGCAFTGSKIIGKSNRRNLYLSLAQHFSITAVETLLVYDWKL